MLPQRTSVTPWRTLINAAGGVIIGDMDTIRVLISLHRGYGLGDAVQMSAVLRHVAKYRPQWRVDFQAEEGYHQVGRGLVENTFAYGGAYPSPHYDAEVQMLLFERFAGWTDRPNTRVSQCLHERFDLPWDEECGRYKVEVRPCSVQAARTLLRCESGKHKVATQFNGRFVAVHYQGNSDPEGKDLTHSQALDICKVIDSLGYVPVILDWREKSPLPYRRLTTPSHWGKDAEMVTAVISQCAAFVGIDSGPGKCASATEVPSLIVWTGHHPAVFHDPAPNTTHIVPNNYHHMKPVCGNWDVMDWFEKHYNVRYYKCNPAVRVVNWLMETLK